MLVTGRDLIVYILENRLEDKPIFENNTFIGFVLAEDVAVSLGVGIETVKAMYKLGYVDGVEINGELLIFANEKASKILVCKE